MKLKHKILLRMENFRTMATDKLDGDRKENEKAIMELKAEGLVTSIMSEFVQEGEILTFSITTRGEKKLKQLLEEIK